MAAWWAGEGSTGQKEKLVHVAPLGYKSRRCRLALIKKKKVMRSD